MSVPSFPSSSPLRVLLTNDDGIQSPGLYSLKLALEKTGCCVTVCAPDRPRSAASHAITLHKPLRISEYKFPDDTVGYAPSGTPSDCALMGLDEVTRGATDLVISGINHGPNVGWDVIYSGTVAAAMEATILGFPAIAVSIASYEQNLQFETAASFIAETLVPAVGAHRLPPEMLLNVNVPNLAPDAIKGVKVTRQGDRQYVDRVEKRMDPTEKPYYWLGGKIHDKESAEGTDTRAVGDGFISVTPIHLDLTAHAFLRDLQGWNIER